MRTIRIVVVVLSLGAVMTVPLHGQSIASLGFAAGASVPTSGFGDRAKTGYHAMVTLGIHVPLLPTAFRAEGMFNAFDYRDTFGSTFPITNRTAHVWVGTANAVLSSPGILGPYLIGGVGIYHLTEANTVLGGSASASKVGGNIGGGLRLGLAGFSAYAEARYHWVSNTDVHMVPLTFGLSF